MSPGKYFRIGCVVNEMQENIDAEKAIRIIAKKEGITATEVRNEIQLAMRAWLCSRDPRIQARWSKIPCKGKEPTPEEFIAYLSAKIDADLDPFL